jgi:peroxiredoxin
MRFTIVFFALLVFATNVYSQKTPYDYGMDTTQTLPQGIDVGDKVQNFKTTDIDGNKVELKQLLKSGPVVVLFYRGEWCPVCNRYLSELNNTLPAIKEKGASVLVISPELVTNASKTKENSHSDFVFVSDSDLKICESFDVLFTVTEKYQSKINNKLKKDIKENNGAAEAKLPVPATFIIDQKGKVIYKQFEYNYRNRASAEDILKML